MPGRLILGVATVGSRVGLVLRDGARLLDYSLLDAPALDGRERVRQVLDIVGQIEGNANAELLQEAVDAGLPPGEASVAIATIGPTGHYWASTAVWPHIICGALLAARDDPPGQIMLVRHDEAYGCRLDDEGLLDYPEELIGPRERRPGRHRSPRSTGGVLLVLRKAWDVAGIAAAADHKLDSQGDGS